MLLFHTVWRTRRRAVSQYISILILPWDIPVNYGQLLMNDTIVVIHEPHHFLRQYLQHTARVENQKGTNSTGATNNSISYESSKNLHRENCLVIRRDLSSSVPIVLESLLTTESSCMTDCRKLTMRSHSILLRVRSSNRIIRKVARWQRLRNNVFSVLGWNESCFATFKRRFGPAGKFSPIISNDCWVQR